MQHILYISIIFFLNAVLLSAQDFEISYAPDYIETSYQTNKSFELTIKSYSDNIKELQLSINQTLLSGGSIAKICLGNECSTESLRIKINPNEPTAKLSLNFYGGLTEINSNLIIQVKDLNYKHELNKEINIKVTDFLNNQLLFESGDNKFDNLFPNPAIEYAAMNYNIKTNNATIILQNVLGSIINEFQIDPNKDRLVVDTEQLNPGIYFYTLLIDGEGLATKKLIVKK